MANPQPDKFTRLSNELLEAIIQTEFSKRQRAIIDLIFRLSYGCGKKTCIIPLQRNFEITGIGISHIKKVLFELKSYQVIDFKDNEYWLIKDYDKWKLPKHFDKELMKHLLNVNLNSRNGNYQNSNYQKGNKKWNLITKTVTFLLPKRELGEGLNTRNHYKKDPPKERVKDNIKEKKKEDFLQNPEEEESDERLSSDEAKKLIGELIDEIDKKEPEKKKGLTASERMKQQGLIRSDEEKEKGGLV